MTTPRLRESLLPGLGHLRRGQLRTGLTFLAWSAAWIATLALSRPGLARAGSGGGTGELIAIGTLLSLPLLLIFLAHRSLRVRRWAWLRAAKHAACDLGALPADAARRTRRRAPR